MVATPFAWPSPQYASAAPPARAVAPAAGTRFRFDPWDAARGTLA